VIDGDIARGVWICLGFANKAGRGVHRSRGGGDRGKDGRVKARVNPGGNRGISALLIKLSEFEIVSMLLDEGLCLCDLCKAHTN
jgi:hypothetical protein